MGGMYGADVAQLRSLAALFDSKANQLDASRMTVGNAIQISAWFGPVAVRFRAQWDSQYSCQVHDAATRLHTAATDLRRNADEQDNASAVGGAGGRSYGPVFGETSSTAVGARLDAGPRPVFGDLSGLASGVTRMMDVLFRRLDYVMNGAPLDQASAQKRFADGYPGGIPNPAAKGECTSWAQYRRAELHLSIPHGNGGDMAGNVGPTTDVPSFGAVASIPSRGADDPGHVMIVERVERSSPLKIEVSEMNWADHGGGYGKVSTRELVEESPGVWREDPHGVAFHVSFSEPSDVFPQ